MFGWLESGARFLVGLIPGLAPGDRLYEALSFFLYDSIKIMLLLLAISYLMGWVNALMPIDRVRHWLTSRKWYGFDYLVSATFGAITPFCSCSSVPLFIGFVQGGLPLGVTFAYLITGPLVNEVAIAIFLGTFGLRITAIYVASGIALGVAGGWIMGRLRLEGWLTDWVKGILARGTRMAGPNQNTRRNWRELAGQTAAEAWRIVKGVAVYVVVGIGIGAFMHGYLPEGFFARYLSGDTWYGVPLAVVLAVPMYANAAGIIPVVEVLVAKGVPIGTALAFMMAVVGLSLPEATLLKKVMTLRLIGVFFGVVTLCIMLLGFFYNLVL